MVVDNKTTTIFGSNRGIPKTQRVLASTNSNPDGVFGRILCNFLYKFQCHCRYSWYLKMCLLFKKCDKFVKKSNICACCQPCWRATMLNCGASADNASNIPSTLAGNLQHAHKYTTTQKHLNANTLQHSLHFDWKIAKQTLKDKISKEACIHCGVEKGVLLRQVCIC